jgi:hypothetical protein
MKFNCPCCNYKTLEDEPPGTFQICPVCYWEDDNVQFDNVNFSGGANNVSLNVAKENFKTIGAVEDRFIAFVRLPFDNE